MNEYGAKIVVLAMLRQSMVVEMTSVRLGHLATDVACYMPYIPLYITPPMGVVPLLIQEVALLPFHRRLRKRRRA
jgi:hypothetical protein